MKKIISFIIRNVPRKYLQLFSPVALSVFKIVNIGNTVSCNVCGKSYKKFLPYGRMQSRENALCPNCLSLERHRLMQFYLAEKTNFYQDNLKVLHVAPEHCFISRFNKLKNIKYVTADIESPLAMVKMDIHEIPFEAASYDVVFCNHVMEHVRDDIKAMSEIHRVLKPGGWAIIQSPLWPNLKDTYENPSITDPKERERIFGQNDHVRNYGTDYGRRLEKAGFTVTEDKFVMEMPKEKVKRYCLPAEEIIYFCRKQ